MIEQQKLSELSISDLDSLRGIFKAQVSDAVRNKSVSSANEFQDALTLTSDELRNRIRAIFPKLKDKI